jgi:hypothetical protein
LVIGQTIGNMVVDGLSGDNEIEEAKNRVRVDILFIADPLRLQLRLVRDSASIVAAP